MAVPIRAAQYLRMSTEDQVYSIENQQAAIARYAEDRGFDVVCSYLDAGRSGLTLTGRTGLQALLADALGPAPDFKAILVFDVSRWGRFQDVDQAAHYEFLCRRAGIAVEYCIDPFEADDQYVDLGKGLRGLYEFVWVERRPWEVEVVTQCENAVWRIGLEWIEAAIEPK